MIVRQLFIWFILLVTISILSAQTNIIADQGYFIIQDKPAFKKGGCVFCDPASMPDRIILDSTKKMIAKKTSNPLGFTYYEWRNVNYEKSYEEIQLPPYNYRFAVYRTDSGSFHPLAKNNFNRQGWVHYFLAPQYQTTL